MSKVVGTLFGKPAQATQSSAQGLAALPKGIRGSSEQAISNLGLLDPNIYKPADINQYEQQAFDARAQPVQTYDQLNYADRIGTFINPFRDALTADYQKLLGQQQSRLAADANRYGLGGSAYQALSGGQLSEGTMRALGTTLANIYNPAVNAAFSTVNREDQLKQQRISDLLSSGAQVRSVQEGQKLAPATKEQAVIRGIASLPATSTSSATSTGASDGIIGSISKAGGSILSALTGGANPYQGGGQAAPLSQPNFVQPSQMQPMASYAPQQSTGFINPFSSTGTGQFITAAPTNYGNISDSYGNIIAGNGMNGGQYNIAAPTSVTAYQAKPLAAPSLGSQFASFFGL